MRLEALAILAWSSSSLAGAIWARNPSAPPYPIPSVTANTTSYGLTAASSSTSPSSSSSLSPSTGEPTWSSSVYDATTSLPTSTGNYTTSSSASSQPAYPTSSTSTPKPFGNSISLSPSKCTGQTLNVLDASLDWWYTRTLYNVVSTISLQYNRNDSRTGWTILPATTPFDLSSALASPTCESTLTFNTVYNISLYDINCTPAPTPVAAATTVITQTAYSQLNASTGVGNIPNVVSTPPPATITIPNSGGAYREGTTFVYFSSYEIVTKSLSAYGNGSASCAAVIQTYSMDSAFSFEYEGRAVNGTKAVGAGVTGDVNPAFLGVVGQSNAVAGSWVAAPTVAIVVQDIFAAEVVRVAVQGPLKFTQTILQTPEPTLPLGFTTGPAQTGWPPPPNTSGRIESTARSLAVPTQVDFPGGTTTSPGANSPTQPPGAPRPTNTPGGNTRTKPEGSNTLPNNGPGPQPTRTTVAVDTIISAILNAVTPTNALQVLQQAENTLAHTDPIASTITHALDNSPPGASSTGFDNQNHIGTGQDGKPTLVVGGTTITANSKTEFDIGTATLTPGGIITAGGTTVSLASDFSAVVVNGQTHAATSPAPILTVGGQSLTPGGIITVSGTTLSFATDGSSIVVNGITQNIGPATSTALAATLTAPPVLTIGSETFTAINKDYTYVINGVTLRPGEQETVTVDGKTYIASLASGATVLVVETMGPNGDATATAYETFFSGSGKQPTITNTVNVVGASSGAVPSAGPSQSVQPALQGAAVTMGLQVGGICITFTTLFLTLWL